MITLTLVWFTVIMPLTLRQGAVLKRLRRSEYAARELAAATAQADEDKAKFSPIATSARARLEVVLIGDPDRTCRGDMARMTQILSNLTNNAIRFKQGGAIFVTIDNRFARTLSLTIRDTEVGMTPPEVSGALVPFSRADGGATRARGGAGMGLTIVKKTG